MKTLQHFIITLLTLFIIGLLGCSKESTETEVNGFVMDGTTGERLPGAKVFLQRTNSSCFSCQGGAIAMETADGNGNFTFNFEHEKDYIYSVIANHINYWDGTNSGFSIKTGEKNTALLTLTPKAYIRVFIKNTSPFDGDDKLGLSGFGGGGDNFYGMTVDTSIVKTTLGNQSIIIYWGVTKNNTFSSFSSSIYAPAFDTTNFTINY